MMAFILLTVYSEPGMVLSAFKSVPFNNLQGLFCDIFIGEIGAQGRLKNVFVGVLVDFKCCISFSCTSR